MLLTLVMQGVSKRASQWYSKCYHVASATKTFTLKGVQTIHRSVLSVNVFVMLATQKHLEYHCKALFFKHPVLKESHGQKGESLRQWRSTVNVSSARSSTPGFLFLFLCSNLSSVHVTTITWDIKPSRRQPSAQGYNWATLSLGDINTGTWPSRLEESQMRQ
jgi:hypothetical protein